MPQDDIKYYIACQCRSFSATPDFIHWGQAFGDYRTALAKAKEYQDAETGTNVFVVLNGKYIFIATLLHRAFSRLSIALVVSFFTNCLTKTSIEKRPFIGTLLKKIRANILNTQQKSFNKNHRRTKNESRCT